MPLTAAPHGRSPQAHCPTPPLPPRQCASAPPQHSNAKTNQRIQYHHRPFSQSRTHTPHRNTTTTLPLARSHTRTSSAPSCCCSTRSPVTAVLAELAQLTMAMPPLSLSLLLLVCVAAVWPAAEAARFVCNATAPRASTCQALVSYAPPNATTLAAVRALFQLRSHRALLASNGLPLSTPPSAQAPSPLRVRLPCLCSGGAGATFQRPTYRIRAGDTLDAIARGVFAGLVTYQDVAAANNVSDPNKVAVGQELWIPVPCSCDPVAGEPVVHYTYVVPAGSTVAGIAQDYGTTEATILALNRMPDAKSLLAGQVLDVPLRACASSISNTAIDRNLRVPNSSYILTANNCIMCGCSSTTWQLDCRPTQGISSSFCPVAKCGDLFLGNMSAPTTASACESTACSYAGYTNTTSFSILANLTTTSMCNADGVSPSAQPVKSSAFGSATRLRWSELVVCLHVVLLCVGFLRHH